MTCEFNFQNVTPLHYLNMTQWFADNSKRLYFVIIWYITLLVFIMLTLVLWFLNKAIDCTGNIVSQAASWCQFLQDSLDSLDKSIDS